MLGFEFCEAILRWGDACPDRRKSVYQSEQALLLSLQKLFGLLAPFVCESEQALVLDSQNPSWEIFPNPTFFLKRK